MAFRTKYIVRSLGLCLLLTACGAQQNAGGIHDPYEEDNRNVHETNLALDKGLVKPISTAYGKAVPEVARQGLSNVSDTLGLPGVVVNDVLQLQFGDALHNTARFAFNATLGLGGLLDAASDGNLEERDTDFGETLHVWGVKEGAFVMLPLYGPSTTRDTVGLIVDIALDPLGNALTPAASSAKTGLKVADLANTRYTYSDIYESVVYDSADGYAQLRLSYLDRRRFELGAPIDQASGEDAASSTYDIYEDFYE